MAPNAPIEQITPILTADQWIAQNPPLDGEKTIEYFERYKKAHKRPLSIQLFSKHVRKAGFVNFNNKKYHTWIHKK